MAGMLRAALKFICWESVLLTAGVVMFPAPSAVSFLMICGAFGILWIELIERKAHYLLDESSPRLSLISVTWATIAIAYLALESLGPSIEHRLWISGQFGEPPDNRYVRILDSRKTQTLVFEFGVRFAPISNPTVGFTSNFENNAQMIDQWFGPSMSFLKPDQRRFPDPISHPIDVTLFGMDTHTGEVLDLLNAITPDKSFFVRTEYMPHEVECVFMNEKERGATEFKHVECLITRDP